MSFTFKIVLLLLITYLNLFSNSESTIESNTLFEITLTSNFTHSNFLDKEFLRSEFICDNGKSYIVSGFWNGSNNYKVRFNPPFVGKWKYTTICSDKNDLSLNNVHGEFNVFSNISINKLNSNGKLVVSSDNRHLIYENGIPYFCFWDTAWEITSKSDYKDMLYYLDKRRDQGFNGIMLCALSHINFPIGGVFNSQQKQAFVNGDYSKPNYEYFEYLDSIIFNINSRGMVAIINPVWSNNCELYSFYNYHEKCFTVEQVFKLAAYMSARYSGRNVIWISGTDEAYDTSEKKEFIKQTALAIRFADGGRSLITVHPHGWSSSVDYFDSTDSWLDFNMYQSSHTIGGDMTYKGAIQGYSLNKYKPLIDGEANYEDIFNNLNPDGILNPNSLRINSSFVRLSRYQSFLSGAYMGITYGANGVWQWTTDTPGFQFSRYNWKRALEFSGAKDLKLMKEFMIKFDWFELVPHQSLLSLNTSDYKIPVSSSNKYIIAYLPSNTKCASFRYDSLSNKIEYILLNPTNGDTLEYGTNNPNDMTGEILISRKDTNDALLVIRKYTIDIKMEINQKKL
ncbi:MAG: DUF4038 domain-containing protein [Chlorobiota bacterium]|nr:DUF4038 domain-containing protein [Chlorobiota bacterium]QQS67287.1 MAG: DUF4038 domain-containing protein [Chlorobiota bacterium]